MALDVIDFKKYDSYKSRIPFTLNEPNELVKCEFFDVKRLTFNKPLDLDYHLLDSFVIYLCIEGNAEIHYNDNDYETITKGETVLIPADLKEITLKPIESATVLEIFIG